MKIGIDARFYGTLGKGLGRYVSELISQLERLDGQNEYVIFLRAENFNEYEPASPRFTKVLAEFPWYGWREQILYPLWLRKFRLDLMHFPHFNVPFLYRRPFVVTIHDLILLRHPTTRATTLGPLRFFLKFTAYRLVIASALRSARAVITVSNAVRADIQERFPFMRAKKIAVTYEAVAASLSANSREAGAQVRAPRAEAVPAPFALYVGNAYPHKNLSVLLSAFAEFRKRGFAGHRLVLVGSQDYFYERLRHEAAKLGVADQVMFFGRATDTELATLYRRAEMYVFPSLCEGFGLPTLEAMANGLAVASSNAACMPEILGDAALYFDPTNPESMTRAMTELTTDGDLRKRLIEKGTARVAMYDWRDCAQKTLDVYLHATRHSHA